VSLVVICLSSAIRCSFKLEVVLVQSVATLLFSLVQTALFCVGTWKAFFLVDIRVVQIAAKVTEECLPGGEELVEA
jgi:hypothetical protein